MSERKYKIVFIQGYFKELNFEKIPTLPVQIVKLLISSRHVTLELIKKRLKAPNQTIKNIPVFLDAFIKEGIIIKKNNFFYLNRYNLKTLFALFPETQDIVFAKFMGLKPCKLAFNHKHPEIYSNVV